MIHSIRSPKVSGANEIKKKITIAWRGAFVSGSKVLLCLSTLPVVTGSEGPCRKLRDSGFGCHSLRTGGFGMRPLISFVIRPYSHCGSHPGEITW